MIDKDNTFKYLNPKFRELFGYELNDVPDGKTWFRKAYPDPTYRHDVISIWINDLKSFEPGEKIHRTFTVNCKDGTEKVVNFIPVLLETDEILMACEDITELMRGEEALRKSEEAAKRIAKEDMIVAEISRIISSTLNIEEVYERFAEEVHKLIPFDRLAINIINPDGYTITVAYVTGVEIDGRCQGEVIPLKSTLTEEIIRTRSGGFIEMEDEGELVCRFPGLSPTFPAGLRSLMSSPLISKDQGIGCLHFLSTKPNAYKEMDLKIAEKVGNQIAGAIANALLFAERKRAEEALKKSEAKFQGLFDEAPVGYHEVDIEGRITRVNRTELEMLGYTAEEMLGEFLWKFNAEEEISRQIIMAKISGTIPYGRAFERIYRKKNGTTLPVLIEDRLLQNEDGRIIGIRSTIQDITERKQTEEEKASLQEQLRQSQKMEAIGQLAGGIAHDFNNLLTVIKGYSQLSLYDLKESDPLKGNIEEIQKASQRAADLTRQLLAFSRRQILEFKVLGLNTILRDLDKILHRVISEDIELVTLLADDLGRVKTDPGQVEQVIMNLVVNARDAMPSGGKLTIETADVELDEAYARAHVAVTPGRYVMLSVSDTGVGMTPEVRDRVFEPFFTTKEKGKGTGLGLSTVYGIVKQSGGNIWVYSEPGVGTTFKIYLPRADELPEEMRKKEIVEEIPLGSETILVVEDEESVRKLAVKILEKHGYNLLEASNGADASAICEKRKEPIHLILTDVVMPGMSGRQLVEQFREVHQNFKVLYMSGYTDNTIVHHGVLEKGVNYIQKPFTPDALARKVREVLDQ